MSAAFICAAWYSVLSVRQDADMSVLQRGRIFDLAILAETQRHLDYLFSNPAYAQSLKTPDGSRVIFDTQAKMDGLFRLSVEMDDLAREVAKEQDPVLALSGPPSLANSRKAIENQLIPG